jgi:hypothetical protein
MSGSLPIEYRAVVQDARGKEVEIDLDATGWLTIPEVASARTFTLKPKDDVDALPIISVHLAPLPDGKPKKLVYFSRVFGQVETSAEQIVSEAQFPLFRLYCIGWEAEIGGRVLRSVSWIYPGGSIVQADEPPYVNDLIEHYAAARRLAAEVPAA